MSNKIDIKSLAVGAFLAIIIALAISADTASSSTAWEYKVIYSRPISDMEEKFNAAGKDGWEVVTSLPYDERGGVYSVGKRPKK